MPLFNHAEDSDRHSPSAESPIPPVMCGPLTPAEHPPQPINHCHSSPPSHRYWPPRSITDC